MSHKEDFDLTQEEADRLKSALKDEKFRKLLSEYVEEISDPANKRQYEEEIIQLESERGVNVKFVNPTPGFVLKSVQLSDGKKAFINICQSEAVEKASSKPALGKVHGEDWSIPFSLSPGREDLDKSGQRCMVYDVVYHPETFEKSTLNSRFEDILVETAIDGIERELKVKLDRKAGKKLKMKYKGIPHSTIIRKKTEDSQPAPGHLPNPWVPPIKGSTLKRQHQKPLNEPNYTITHHDEFSMLDYTYSKESTLIRRPRELVVSVELPGVLSADCIKLDVFEKQLSLECSDPIYHLELPLPYPVHEEKCVAHLDKAACHLTLTLPVMPVNLAPLTESCPDTKGSNEETPPYGSSHAQCGSHELPNDAQSGPHEPLNDPQHGSHDVQHGSHDVQHGSHDVQLGSHDVNAQQDATSKSWSCPPYDYLQNDECVSFVLHVPGAKGGSVVTYADDHMIHVTFTSASHSHGFSFFASFPTTCKIESSSYKVDVSAENVLVVVKKSEECKGIWDKMKVGSDCAHNTIHLQDKLFVTNTNLLHINDSPDSWVSSNKTSAVSCEVASVSVDALNLVVKTLPTRELVTTEPSEPAKVEQKESPENKSTELGSESCVTSIANKSKDAVQTAADTKSKIDVKATLKTQAVSNTLNLTNHLLYELD
eukprot:Em0023g53a